MRSSNPVLTSLVNDRGNAYGAYTNNVNSPFGAAYSSQVSDDNRPMTVDDVVSKTAITVGVIIVFAVLNFGIALWVSTSMAMLLTIVGGIGGFITVLVSAFSKSYGSKAITLTYAVLEGLFLGGFSLLLTGVTVGGANAGVMISQAILGTIGVFLGMLYVYKTGAVKVTPKFNRVVTASIIGVAVLALGNLLLAVFTGANPLRDGGTLAIIFSLVCIGLAAMSFLQDFDLADRMVRQGAPAKSAWGIALGLSVTLVWLYTEILRLLSYFQQR
ncbi:hypothetical membrane protein [Corynebacterium kutscheri]|uniref:Hypothetical membrane protein n=1 Tax=Corynebacterium kutscheri TaxID=35755 RepID=A0A0F6R0K0_9CORY|nr:Bax inhibitor-1/YccA family protein [Corynebacterium kutscheri]AKE41782.1 putative membrane protein [Corynebacterium kutscheri]VEH09057.1 hypothetical membrane protein [Corynebacterium kutscheri]VEH10108.1 hypothetical membrane protein [Corynebacterium kutscheri]VEH80190.1 hypothetical membrane protein [Corynebacterium kutscheri]